MPKIITTLDDSEILKYSIEFTNDPNENDTRNIIGFLNQVSSIGVKFYVDRGRFTDYNIELIGTEYQVFNLLVSYYNLHLTVEAMRRDYRR